MSILIALLGFALAPDAIALASEPSTLPADVQAATEIVHVSASAGSDLLADGVQDRETSPEEQAVSQGNPEHPQGEKPPTPPHTGVHALLDGLREDVKHLPSRPNLYLTMIGGGLALGTHPFDQSFNVHLRSHYELVNGIFAPAKYYGDTPEQVALSLATYGFGRLFDYPKVSHLGMDLLRAEAVSELLTEPIKLSTHRLRPDGSNYQSFPSGHAAVTFAAATVIERHLGWKRAAVAYAIASYVAASRLHDNVHYLSDVAFGAAVGSIAGRTVTEHGREMWTLAPVAVAGGAALVLMRAP